MTTEEAAVFAFGMLVMFAGSVWAYRYTISPKAPERMAEANRRYVPASEKPRDWRRAAIVYAALWLVRIASVVVAGSPFLLVLWTAVGVGEAVVVYKAWRQERRGDLGARGGTRTPTSEDTGT